MSGISFSPDAPRGRHRTPQGPDRENALFTGAGPRTRQAFRGMAASPHHLASQAGVTVLQQGGNAVEAAVAVAAVLCVVYPHMTGLGGDGFWLILPAPFRSGTGAFPGPGPEEASEQAPGRDCRRPVFIDACGRSALRASQTWYERHGCASLPARGPLAALTMAGAVSGWALALETARTWPGASEQVRPLALETLLADAIALARDGFPISSSQADMTRLRMRELAGQPGFAASFLPYGRAPLPGSRLRLPALARTFERLARHGLDDFYRGGLAADLAHDLSALGSPLEAADFAAHRAEARPPLSLRVQGAELFNAPPPTQGMASLAILGLVERYLKRTGADPTREAVFVHAVVEATKQAFLFRDAHLADPGHMRCDPARLLDPAFMDDLARRMAPDRALPWPHGTPGGDTVWFGVVDGRGNAVSCIQSLYHEFGCGVVLPRTGLTWQNRGVGFCMGEAARDHPNALEPCKKPFHTLNPALAVCDDGRVVVYGTMGGEGQPQTQAAVFLRYLLQGMPLARALAAPRWVLGRTWGDDASCLRLEPGFGPGVVDELGDAGHVLEVLESMSSLMGHAGALVRWPDGLLEGAFDPRSDGDAAGW